MYIQKQTFTQSHFYKSNPRTKYAPSVAGFKTTLADNGNENELVILIVFIAFRLISETSKRLAPPL